MESVMNYIFLNKYFKTLLFLLNGVKLPFGYYKKTYIFVCNKNLQLNLSFFLRSQRPKMEPLDYGMWFWVCM